MKFVQIITLSLLLACGSTAIDRNWWKSTTIYEVFLKSFKDGDGDGIGDFKGLMSKLDYFNDLGIDTVWVTPYFPSPKADGGYDIVDFYGIDPIYGTMEDFEQLMKEMKKRGLNFVMDLVINHSSDEHEWFQKSINKVEPYTDYYVWVNPKGYDQNGNPIPPNNWVSIFDLKTPSSGWTWNKQRNQFYFHQFLDKQPDFNLRNENVKKEVKAIMKFWLDKGVTAFRVDAPPFFMEDPQLRDEYYGNDFARIVAGTEERSSRRLHHPDNYVFLNELYLFVREYDRKNKKERETAMMVESYATMDVIMKYYGTKNMPSSHFPFNFQLTTLKRYLNAQEMIDYLNDWLKRLPEGVTSNWALGNHDQGRIFNRFNREYNSILLPLVTMLPGAACIYYGEEASQEMFDFTPERVKNLWLERDHFRLPMQWDDSFNAGFTSGDKPWVPLHPSYWRTNVAAQKARPNSHLNFFRDLVSIRKTDTFKYGDLKLYAISKWVLAFTRIYRKSKYIVVLNLGMENNFVDLHSNIPDLPPFLTVAAASTNSGYKKGEQFSTVLDRRNASILRPQSSIVLIVPEIKSLQ